MEEVIEFFSRCIGPMLFGIGVMIFLTMYEVTNGYLATAQKEYVQDDVLSQKHTKTDDVSGTITSSELEALAISGFTQDSIIENEETGRLISVEAYDNYCWITVTERNVEVFQGRVNDFSAWVAEDDNGNVVYSIYDLFDSAKYSVEQEKVIDHCVVKYKAVK